MIRVFVLHLGGQTRRMVSDALAWFAVICLILMSFTFWPGGPNPLAGVDTSSLDRLLAGGLGLVCYLAGVASLGAAVASRRSLGERVHPMPALPIGPRMRTLAEVLPFAALAVLARVLFAEPLAGGADMVEGRPGLLNVLSTADLLESLPGGLVVLSLIAFCAAPFRSTVETVLRIVVVSFLPFALAGFATGPTETLVAGVLLLTLWWLTADWVPPLPHRLFRRSGRAPLYRRGLPVPAHQLRRDHRGRTLRLMGVVVAAAVVLSSFPPLFLRIDTAAAGHPIFAGLYFMVSATVFILVLGLPAYAAFTPMGDNRPLQDFGRSFSSGLRSEYLRSWSVLPVRPVDVRRGLFGHALCVGILLWAGLGLLSALVDGLPSGVDLWGHGLHESAWGQLHLPYGAMIPCLAGTALAAAVGDRRAALICGVLSMLTMPIGYNVLWNLLDGQIFPAAYESVSRNLQDGTITHSVVHRCSVPLFLHGPLLLAAPLVSTLLIVPHLRARANDAAMD